MKHNNEKQHRNRAMKLRNEKQLPTTMKPTKKQRNKKQQFYNNHITIVQQ